MRVRLGGAVVALVGSALSAGGVVTATGRAEAAHSAARCTPPAG